jgi:hypothetical protein
VVRTYNDTAETTVSYQPQKLFVGRVQAYVYMAAEELYTTDPVETPAPTADEPFDADVTVYLRGTAPTVARERQEATVARLEALEELGLLPELTVEQWPSRSNVPSDGPADPVVDTYDEFAAAAGEGVHLDPFFDDRPGIGRSSRVVVFPVIAVAVRREGELTGLYPCWKDGHHHSVEEALDGLETGADVENLD